MPHPRPTLATLLLLGVLALAGCADREEPAGTEGDDSGAFPVEVQAEGAPAVTLETRPERIVSLSPVATETLYAVGAGAQVVAVDAVSNHPEQAPTTELSGLNPDPEAILAHQPDLVVVNADLENKLADALAPTGTKTLVLPAAATLDAAYRQFELLGTATGHRAEGEDLARRTREDLAKIVADTPEPEQPLTYYHEVDETFYSVTSTTFIGQVYDRFGLTNIADGDDPNAAGGYPQLSAETILRADPDLIFLADTVCCGQNAETVAQRPGWDTLTAVREGRVVELNDDIASRWSPRVVDFARAVSEAVTTAVAGTSE
ncbi:ABC transporter substrate-binding protein [Amycolatopsis cihanbeyliensis]|uniref:Iron complex transport system substrate-binding protein n=1 Tax=Amycolatopsis cihanbeyliensis TaxID=1128664 RepID=A0A542DG70_AMYCI|nr:ABC transporter substrate-binding protein [Amycolatopsis cihanbeyliensis]TQJ02079.1 iron complex transport system substrate-binding protein [Amycolatopsis cihanbeyliensis]